MPCRDACQRAIYLDRVLLMLNNAIIPVATCHCVLLPVPIVHFDVLTVLCHMMPLPHTPSTRASDVVLTNVVAVCVRRMTLQRA